MLKYLLCLFAALCFWPVAANAQTPEPVALDPAAQEPVAPQTFAAQQVGPNIVRAGRVSLNLPKGMQLGFFNAEIGNVLISTLYQDYWQEEWQNDFEHARNVGPLNFKPIYQCDVGFAFARPARLFITASNELEQLNTTIFVKTATGHTIQFDELRVNPAQANASGVGQNYAWQVNNRNLINFYTPILQIFKHYRPNSPSDSDLHASQNSAPNSVLPGFFAQQANALSGPSSTLNGNASAFFLEFGRLENLSPQYERINFNLSAHEEIFSAKSGYITMLINCSNVGFTPRLTVPTQNYGSEYSEIYSEEIIRQGPHLVAGQVGKEKIYNQLVRESGYSVGLYGKFELETPKYRLEINLLGSRDSQAEIIALWDKVLSSIRVNY